MRHSILIGLFVFLTTVTIAQNNPKDEMDIKNVLQQQENAWNKHDWETFSKYFTDDGTLINFVGQFWNGKNDILKHFKLLSECCLAPTSLKFEFKSARFLTRDVALVYIEETLFADRDYEVPFHQYKKGDIDNKILTNVFVRTGNEWKIAATQVTLINQILPPQPVNKQG